MFSFGIYIFFHINLLDKLKIKMLLILVSLVVLRMILCRKWYLVWWSNPPSIKAMIYTIVVFLLGYSSVTLLQRVISDKMSYTSFLLELFCVMGRYSLYIYLWHMMLLDILLKYGMLTKPGMGVGERLLINGFILYLPCVLFMLYKKGKELVWR